MYFSVVGVVLCVKSGKEIYMCTESEVMYRGNDIHGKKD